MSSDAPYWRPPAPRGQYGRSTGDLWSRSPFMRTDLGLVPGQLWLSNIDLGDVALSQGLDVSHGLLAEESTVLAAELAHTLVVGISKIGNCGRRTGRPYATSCQRTI